MNRHPYLHDGLNTEAAEKRANIFLGVALPIPGLPNACAHAHIDHLAAKIAEYSEFIKQLSVNLRLTATFYNKKPINSPIRKPQIPMAAYSSGLRIYRVRTMRLITGFSTYSTTGTSTGTSTLRSTIFSTT